MLSTFNNFFPYWHFSFYFQLVTHRLFHGASLVAQMVKNLPAMQKTLFPSQDWKDSLEKRTATHFSILAWRNPWTEAATVHGVTESDTIEQLTHREFYLQKNRLSEVILVITNEETFEAKRGYKTYPRSCRENRTEISNLLTILLLV